MQGPSLINYSQAVPNVKVNYPFVAPNLRATHQGSGSGPQHISTCRQGVGSLPEHGGMGSFRGHRASNGCLHGYRVLSGDKTDRLHTAQGQRTTECPMTRRQVEESLPIAEQTNEEG